MPAPSPDAPAHQKLLFTPGPLNTHPEVRAAMQLDYGSRDGDFIALVAQIRRQLLALAGVSQQQGYEAVLLQGPGTFAIEALLSCALHPQNDHVLVMVNGAYGRRIQQILEHHRLPYTLETWPEDRPIAPARVEELLHQEPRITHLVAVHCETTTGLLNPVAALGELARKHNKTFFLDSMSAFGALPVSLVADNVHALVSSANKCIEGVPGFAYVLLEKAVLHRCAGNAATLSLDLYAQWQGLEKNGQFRYTPPTHTLAAFHKAMELHAAEGGSPARLARYQRRHQQLVEGAIALGLQPFLSPEVQAPIITTFFYPEDEKFDFQLFYEALSAQGFAIYPGKLSHAKVFRVGNIGALPTDAIQRLLTAMQEALEGMGIALPAGRSTPS